jgi:hypothetical protein
MKLQNQVQMKKFSSLFLLFVSFFGSAQNYKGEITNIKEDGLHQIIISPEVRAAANENLDYFRILNSKKQQVPYVNKVATREESPKYNSFKIESKTTIKDSITTIIIKNQTKKKINQFNLQIGNTALSKTYSISGSNNKKEWFGLVANQILSDLVSEKETTLSKTVYFPANEYTFLRIDFKDKSSLPVDVLGIGIFENQFLPEKLIEISDFKYKIIQDKNQKLTKITFSAQNNYQIDALTFDITTEFYVRKAKIVVKRQREIKKRVEVYNEDLDFFDLNSKNDKTIYFTNLNEKEFTVEIENQDNQPLEIKGVRLAQKPLYLYSKLKANENYEVIIDSTLTKPSYDLANFVQSFSVGRAEATIINFQKIEHKENQSTNKSFWQSPLFMWICIVLGGGFVAYFAFGLLKDMKKD